MSEEFNIGKYRPIYLWAGPGTVRMNRLKFINTAVDETAHAEAHTQLGARRVVEDMYCNWIHLTYDWGFPPEIEQEDWDAFAQAAQAFHQAGSPVFAYIQSSNCVFEGSFKEKDWYALDPQGRRITYFTYSGRYMACLANPDWQQHLREMVAGAIEHGADGIFLDNLFQGDQPMAFFGAWLGATGCYCEHCRIAYRQFFGAEIPEIIQQMHFISLDHTDLRRYLRWRSDQVVQLVAMLAEYAKALKPGTPLSANDFDPVMRNSYFVYGIDLERLSQVQDVTMIENFGLPRWIAEPRERLVNNALTLRTAHALVNGRAHLNVLSYDEGIGFDGLYPVRVYQQGIAEAAALGVSMTVKGTEYNDGGAMTVLTPQKYAAVHSALGRYHRWLEENAALYGGGRRNVAPVGLLFPGEALWLDWHGLAPGYFGACQALTAEGIPWRVVRAGERVDGLKALLAFGDDCADVAALPPGVSLVSVNQLEGWQLPSPTFASRSPLIRRVIHSVLEVLTRAYGNVKLVRKFADNAGLYKIFTQSPLYDLPGKTARQALLAALPADLFPRVRAQHPTLMDVWQSEQGLQFHLVNYGPRPQKVLVEFGTLLSGYCLSPDGQGSAAFSGGKIEIELDVYRIFIAKGFDPHVTVGS